jgi:hypothetical protein
MPSTPRRAGLSEQTAVAAIEAACRSLHLPTIRDRAPDAIAPAERGQHTYAALLAELLLASATAATNAAAPAHPRRRPPPSQAAGGLRHRRQSQHPPATLVCLFQPGPSALPHRHRQVNAALHRMAMTQMGVHPPAKGVIQRGRANGDGGMKVLGVLSSDPASPTSSTSVMSGLRDQRRTPRRLTEEPGIVRIAAPGSWQKIRGRTDLVSGFSVKHDGMARAWAGTVTSAAAEGMPTR